MKIAMLAGEPSGDSLGAGLITSLRVHYPQAHFEGIGGAQMIAAGLRSLFPLEQLAVMGLTEILRHLPTLIRIRRALLQHFITHPPSVFIGIDAPEFNLPLERRLRSQSIPVVHYVSPQLWAWRPGRVHRIAQAMDLILTLLPFETTFYKTHHVPVHYVGHPLADEIPFYNDRQQARQQLAGYRREQSYQDEIVHKKHQGTRLAKTNHEYHHPENTLNQFEGKKPILALLPGSRLSEAQHLGPLFFSVARWLREQQPDLTFLLPAATTTLYDYLSTWLRQHMPDLPVIIINGHAREAIAAANVVLVASGTATLETLLIKRPMVVAYKVAPVTGFILSRLISVPRVALPNLLAERNLVPEFIQKAATVENLGAAVRQLLNDETAQQKLIEVFTMLHRQLRCNANRRAADAIARLVK